MKKHIQRFLPWILALLIFGLLFLKIPPGEVLKTLEHMNWPLMLALGAGYFIVVMLVDVWGLSWALNTWVTPISYQETWLMRGATYLLMLLNYNLGQGGMAFYLRRAHQAPLLKTLGIIAFFAIVDLSLLFLFGMAAVLIQDVSYQGRSLRPFLVSGAALFFVGLGLFILVMRHRNHPRLGRLRRIPVLGSDLFWIVNSLKPSQALQMVLFRVPVILMVMAGFRLCLMPFDASVPWSHVLAYAPIILLAGTLPITPGGLGTVQAMCIELFKSDLTSTLLSNAAFSPEKIIFASGMIWSFLNLVCKALCGMACLTVKSRSLFEEESG